MSRWVPAAAVKVVRVDGSGVVVSTYLTFCADRGRLRWAVVAPVHRLLEPALLARAVRQGPH